MTTIHSQEDRTGGKSWSLLGAEITIKDFIQYCVLIVGAVFFVSNMNNRIDNLIVSVDRLNRSFEGKDVVDNAQNSRISILETGVALINQKLQVSPSK